MTQSAANNCYVYTYAYPDSGVVFYVGMGKNKRDREHLSLVRRRKANLKNNILNKICASGQEPIVTRIIDNIDRELAAFIEIEFIAKYGRIDMGTGPLANMTNGGEWNDYWSGRKRDVATMQKMAEARAKVPHGMLGKKHSESAKAKMSAVAMGRTAWNKGKVTPPEVRKKQSLKRLGRPPANKGLPRPESMKEACRLANSVRVSCIHCKKDGAIRAMIRWHMDNCKKRVV